MTFPPLLGSPFEWMFCQTCVLSLSVYVSVFPLALSKSLESLGERMEPFVSLSLADIPREKETTISRENNNCEIGALAFSAFPET